MQNLLQQEHFWTALAFVLFLLLFGKLCYEQIIKYLEHQVNSVKDTVEASSELLETATHDLKNKKLELEILDQKLLESGQKTKENADNFSETFFENLTIREQQLKERFRNYLAMEQQVEVNKLNQQLIDHSYNISLDILKNKLSPKQKADILDRNISQLSSQLQRLTPNG